MGSASILGCLGPRLRREERAFFAEAQPWGFILFSRNIETPDQTLRLTDALREAVGWEAPILIDQEGGRVQRMGAPHWREWLPPLDQVAQAGPASMRLRYEIIARELREVGIDVNCAPMADIAEPLTHPILKNRCYGGDAGTVTQAAQAVVAGLRAGGALPVLKHMPGHGRAHVDSHLDLPVVTEDRATLDATDFAPFQALSDLKMGMTAHVVYTAIDPDRPATHSPVMIDLLRRDLGFGGLLMTDDISMEALGGSLTDRATRARAAGVDLILHCNGDLDEMVEIVGAAGTLDGDALTRADAALAERHMPDPVDIARLARDFDAQMAPRAQDPAHP